MMENENKNVDEIIERLQNGVREIFEGDNFKHYLEVMAKFHTFSSYNWQLIYEQCPNATKLAGYVQWKKDFNRHVKKGEKAIRILAPRFGKGGMRGFKEVCIFDISQTEGEELPDVYVSYKNLQESCSHYKKLYDAFMEISPLPIFFDILDGYNGICYFDKKIAINKGLSQSQTIKTIIHEIAHAILHTNSDADKYTKEVEAESVAYAVCSFFKIDSSDFSFGYVANWSKDKQLDILRSSLETITETANKIISDVLEYLGEDIEEIDFDIEDDVQRARDLYELGMSFYNDTDYNNAVNYFKQAADLGNIDASYQLGVCYQYGYGVRINYKKSYNYMLVAAENGNKYAQNTVGYYLDNGYGTNKNFKKAFEWFLKSAEQGYSRAQFNSGLYYRYSHGNINVDYEKAVYWFSKSAKQGFENAQYQLAECYWNGIGLDVDRKQACNYYSKAYKNGLNKAGYKLIKCYYYKLDVDENVIKTLLEKNIDDEDDEVLFCAGEMYFEGLLVQQDYDKAFELYEKINKESNAKVYYRLAECYFGGLGVSKNLDKAFSYYSDFIDRNIYISDCKIRNRLLDIFDVDDYKKRINGNWISFFHNLADLCNKKAQLLLADCYYNGYGVDVDYTEALSWRKKAAEAGDVQAQLLIAQQYFAGIGILKDVKNAMHWYTLAAENGNTEAQYQLAEFFEIGTDGIRKNLSTAFYWYKKAAEADNVDAILKVGQMYDSGIGTSQNVDKAVYWYEKAAKRNYIDAMFALANIYLYNYRDIEKCISTYETILELTRNNKLKALIMTKLGEFYSLGLGVKKDSYKAMYYYRDAVANGSVDAAYLLGNIYLNQKNYTTPKRAIEVFLLGACGGNIACQKKLAELYLNGVVVQKSRENAIKWFAEAAKNGDIDAEVKMLELLQAKNEIQKSDVEQQEQNANCLHSNIAEKLSDIFS